MGVGFSAVSQMASPVSSLSRRQQSPDLSRAALKARAALVLEHMPLAVAERFRGAVAIASVMARRLFPLVEREDLNQVAREALVRSAPRCRSGEPPAPYLRRCITGGPCPLGHLSLDASPDGEPCLLDQLASPEPEPASSAAEQQLALEQLVEQLPAAQATALRLTLLEGLSLRAAAERLQISAMSVSHREVRLATPLAQKKAIAALRQQLAGGG